MDTTATLPPSAATTAGPTTRRVYGPAGQGFATTLKQAGSSGARAPRASGPGLPPAAAPRLAKPRVAEPAPALRAAPGQSGMVPVLAQHGGSEAGAPRLPVEEAASATPGDATAAASMMAPGLPLPVSQPAAPAPVQASGGLRHPAALAAAIDLAPGSGAREQFGPEPSGPGRAAEKAAEPTAADAATPEAAPGEPIMLPPAVAAAPLQATGGSDGDRGGVAAGVAGAPATAHAPPSVAAGSSVLSGADEGLGGAPSGLAPMAVDGGTAPRPIAVDPRTAPALQPMRDATLLAAPETTPAEPATSAQAPTQAAGQPLAPGATPATRPGPGAVPEAVPQSARAGTTGGSAAGSPAPLAVRGPLAVTPHSAAGAPDDRIPPAARDRPMLSAARAGQSAATQSVADQSAADTAPMPQSATEHLAEPLPLAERPSFTTALPRPEAPSPAGLRPQPIEAGLAIPNGLSPAPAAAPTDQALPTRPATVPQPPARQVAQVAIALSLGSGQAPRLTVALEPEALGRVEIRIERGADGEAASVRVLAERPETLALLQRDARELNRALSQAGVQVAEGALQFGLSSGDPNQGGRQPGPGSGGAGGWAGWGPALPAEATRPAPQALSLLDIAV